MLDYVYRGRRDWGTGSGEVETAIFKQIKCVIVNKEKGVSNNWQTKRF